MFPLFTEPAHSPQTDHWLTDPFYARLKLRARTFFFLILFYFLVYVDELCNTFLMIRDLSKMYPPARHPVSREQKQQPMQFVKTAQINSCAPDA